MSEAFVRSFTPDLEIQTRARGGDGRTVVGIAVPYEYRQRINASLTEQFARGAFNHQIDTAHRVKVAREHIDHGGSLIGRVSKLVDEPAGLYAEMRVSNTPVGEETLELVRDGALTDLSIGFRERQNGRLPDGTVVRRSADLREIAVVLEGAYGGEAAVTAVRGQAEYVNLDTARQLLASLPVLKV